MCTTLAKCDPGIGILGWAHAPQTPGPNRSGSRWCELGLEGFVCLNVPYHKFVEQCFGVGTLFFMHRDQYGDLRRTRPHHLSWPCFQLGEPTSDDFLGCTPTLKNKSLGSRSPGPAPRDILLFATFGFFFGFGQRRG